MKLNVVYIGEPKFPFGNATTKRRRYMVDYLNEHNISCHVLVCGHTICQNNPQSGTYRSTDYYDISNLSVNKKPFKFWREGSKIIKNWYKTDYKNILIFATRLLPLQFPFYLYARKLGYKTVFDQVETSILKSGKLGWKSIVNEWLGDKLSQYGFSNSSSFVISSALYKLNKDRYPNSKLCLLPNSTPIFQITPKNSLHKPLKILYAGTFAPKDGVKYLIDGAIKAYNKGCNIELILLGKGLPWDMKVLEKLNDYSWGKYLGFVSDEELLHQMMNADVLCMTRTNSEFANFGFPFKLSEYLSTGNILMASKVGDVCKYVEDKENALLVNPEDSDSIADAIKWVINNEKAAINIAHNSVNTVEKYFSVEVVGKIFVDFLMKV